LPSVVEKRTGGIAAEQYNATASRIKSEGVSAPWIRANVLFLCPEKPWHDSTSSQECRGLDRLSGRPFSSCARFYSGLSNCAATVWGGTGLAATAGRLRRGAGDYRAACIKPKFTTIGRRQICIIRTWLTEAPGVPSPWPLRPFTHRHASESR